MTEERQAVSKSNYRIVTSGHAFCLICGERGETPDTVPHPRNCPEREKKIAAIRALKGKP